MSKLNPQDQVVATLQLDAAHLIHEIVEGKVDEPIFASGSRVYITEAQLLQMNVFMRNKWEKMKQQLADNSLKRLEDGQ